MKNVIVLASLALISSSSSFALVRELADCTTPNQEYRVTVTDNQGIGLDRTSHITAHVTDAQGEIVAAYQVNSYRGMSVSFGRAGFIDTASNGKAFSLMGPSTNFRHDSLNVQTNVGGNSFEIKSDDLTCTILNGSIVRN